MCLVAEKIFATRHRRAIGHVIHVNGTRGKSAVTRLIAAGLSEGGIKTYCKTTGTLPMTIDTKGNETEIKRLGKANISEQIKILKAAYKDGAEALVLECMAVDPELQHVCEHKILHSDIGVITNARVDHVAEMGSTTAGVCEALSNTIPKCGITFTADKDQFETIKFKAKSLRGTAVLADKCDFDASEFLFPENIALALAVCEYVGVDRELALAGMRKVKPDPYEAKAYTLEGITFVNGMSANDPVSTEMVYDRFKHLKTKDGKSVVVLNTRPDRGYRTGLMIDYIKKQSPDIVWLLGSGRRVASMRLRKCGFETREYAGADKLPIESLPDGSLIFAIGNIANEGIALMDIIESKGKEELSCTEK